MENFFQLCGGVVLSIGRLSEAADSRLSASVQLWMSESADFEAEEFKKSDGREFFQGYGDGLRLPAEAYHRKLGVRIVS